MRQTNWHEMFRQRQIGWLGKIFHFQPSPCIWLPIKLNTWVVIQLFYLRVQPGMVGLAKLLQEDIHYTEGHTV